MKNRILMVLLAALVSTGVACKDEPKAPAKKDETSGQEADEEETNPLLAKRQAFGLPIPPEVTLVREGPRFVYVETPLKVAEVRKFFEERIVDYEFLQETPYRLKIIGLRSGMPQVHVWYRRSALPTSIRYIEPVEEKPRPKTEEEKKQRIAQKAEERKKGAPVTQRMPNGDLMAPGARWGEPYTPPPGSPLDQPRFRANFGKPFGEWIPN